MALCIVVLDGRVHDRAGFSCGVATLDDYLRTRASQHARDGIATTHALIDEDAPQRILGYCTLSAAHLLLSDLAEADRARLPAHPVPAMRMGRLAVAQAEQGRGHGALLIGHAANLALNVRQTLGVRVLIVDAKDARTAAFYRAYGFRPTASAALTLYLPLGRA